MKKKIQLMITCVTILSLITTLFLIPAQMAYASGVLNRSNTMSSLRTNTPSNHTIVFRTVTGAAELTDTITVTFPAGFNMNTVAFDDFDLAHSAGGQANCTSPT